LATTKWPQLVDEDDQPQADDHLQYGKPGVEALPMQLAAIRCRPTGYLLGGPAVDGDNRVERRPRVKVVVFQHGPTGRHNFVESHLAGEKTGHRRLVRRIEHRATGAPVAGGVHPQLQGIEPPQVGRLEVQPHRLRPIHPLGDPLATLRPLQGQSVVHSLELSDGSVIAQLSPPDMRLADQLALEWPERREGIAQRVDWTEPMRLDFEPPDLGRFDALQWGWTPPATGAPVARCSMRRTRRRWRFSLRPDGIRRNCAGLRAVLEHHNFDPRRRSTRLSAIDRWARQEVSRWVCT